MQSVLDGSVDGRSRNFPLGVDGFAFEDLFDADGLVALLASFESELEVTDSALFQRYAAVAASDLPGTPPSAMV